MIRFRVEWWLTPVAVAFLVCCGDREKPATPEPADASAREAPPTLAVPVIPEPVTEPEPGAVLSRSRADVLGFARHIPADAEALVTFHNGATAFERARRMKLWNAISPGFSGNPFRAPEVDPEDGFEDLQGLAHEDETMEQEMTLSPMDFFGTEVTIALGKGSTKRVGAFLTFNRRSTYHQMRDIASALSDDTEDQSDAYFGGVGSMLFGMNPEMYGDLFTDRIASAALDAFQMPPVYFAVRADGERVREVHEILAEPVRAIAGFNDMVAPVEVVRAGATFSGYRLIGADLAASVEESREYMGDFFGDDVFDRIIEFLKPREFIAVSGILDDYAVAFFGASIDEFRLAESPEEAITHGDTLDFADPHLAHPFHGLLHGEKDLLETVSTSITSLGDIADGLRDGLAARDRDGRNRDLVALLQIVGERERALRALTRHDASGVTIVDDGGLRIEAHGSSSGMLDFSTPLRFAALGEDPDVAVFLNLSINARYSDRSTACQEALFETAHAILMRVMETPDADPGFDPFATIREYAAMFENDFRGDLANIWQAVAHDMRDGLGNESAVVVDLKGTLPVTPGVPDVLLENARAPRVTMLAPVANRARLATAWEKIHENGSRIAGSVGEIRESTIIMPRAIRSESDGLSSWFLPLPFFDDEFLPSVTLNDTWFAMGTSRNQAVELINRLDALAPRPGGGLHLKVNFRLIAESQRELLALIDAHREAILEAGKFEAGDYEIMRARVEAVLAGLEELESLEARCWEEGDLARTRVHLRVRP